MNGGLRNGAESKINYPFYAACLRAYAFAVGGSFSSPEAALLLVSTKNHDLWPGPTPRSAIYGLPGTLRIVRVKSDKSVWFWAQSIVFTKPFRTGISLDLSRGRGS